MDTLLSFDMGILNFIAAHLRTPFLDRVMPFISALGNMGFIWLFATVVLLFMPRHRKKGFFILLGLFIGFLIVNLLLKPLCARPRPSWLFEVALLIPNPEDFSFPSGHTAAAFIFAFLIAKFSKKAGYIAIPAATLMAYSRLYLYVHYPSDVLFSILLAFCISCVVSRIAKKHMQ